VPGHVRIAGHASCRVLCLATFFHALSDAPYFLVVAIDVRQSVEKDALMLNIVSNVRLTMSRT
jgi:hypothetical protein